ncbi:Chloroperoxidase [Leptodontidium sp. 2 PMI_412]|nr:Chloroperoxidase [Leptodontidium sp. 2 PMI_412]
MKTSLSGLNNGNTSLLKPNHFTFQAPGPDDLRSPCPAMNTLANHGFLPRNGRNITHQMLVSACKDGFNVGPLVPDTAFNLSIALNPEPGATEIDFAMIRTHNIIEHDGSISRRDSFFDPTNPFSAATFDNFLTYWGTDQNITLAATENARARHTFDMSKLNPEFGLSERQAGVFQGEIVLMLGIWGHPDFPHIRRDWFEFFFRNERFPVHLGWSPRDVELDQNVRNIVVAMKAASPTDIPIAFPAADTPVASPVDPAAAPGA